MKKIFVSCFFLSAFSFAAPTPTFTDIARSSDGRPLQVTQFEATAYCDCATDYARQRLGCHTAPGSMHLPSVSELIQLAVSKGAKGILGKDDCFQDVGYCVYLETIVNADFSPFQAYYNFKGFVPPVEWHSDLWSSSFESDRQEIASLLDTHLGSISGADRSWPHGVICASGN